MNNCIHRDCGDVLHINFVKKDYNCKLLPHIILKRITTITYKRSQQKLQKGHKKGVVEQTHS